MTQQQTLDGGVLQCEDTRRCPFCGVDVREERFPFHIRGCEEAQ